MHTVQITSRDLFADRAHKLGIWVTMCRTPTAVPVGTATVVMKPALNIDYSMEFEDPDLGATRWTFREVIMADDQGVLRVPDDSLGFRLGRVSIERRAGSV